MYKGPKDVVPLGLSCSEIALPEAKSQLPSMQAPLFTEVPRPYDSYTTGPGSSRTEFEMEFVDRHGKTFAIAVKASSVEHTKAVSEILRKALSHVV